MTLELLGVTKRYAASSETITAVSEVRLKIAAGELVALYGPSGSGKSTLLQIAAGIEPPDSGQVLFDGQDLTRLSARDKTAVQRAAFGIVYQDDHLLAGVPAADNAAPRLRAQGMRRAEARRRAIPWLERVGLGHRLNHTPAQLSGGERQRVAIARALVNDTRMLFIDEPTGRLDSARGAEVLQLIADVCKERQAGVLLVTHDPRAASFADRVHELRDGKLVTRRDLHDEPSELLEVATDTDAP